jgi:hypothetical protein
MRNARLQHDLNRTIRFLTGLNDNFDLVRSQILLMEPLPPINKVFSNVIQYERQFIAMHGSSDVDENRALVNASDARRGQGRGRGYGNPGRGKRYCTYCGKDNHIVDNCYKKHGFPPSYGRTPQTNQASADETNDLDDTRSYRGNESHGFTKDQYEKLVNLLQSTASTSTSANAA